MSETPTPLTEALRDLCDGCTHWSHAEQEWVHEEEIEALFESHATLERRLHELERAVEDAINDHRHGAYNTAYCRLVATTESRIARKEG